MPNRTPLYNWHLAHGARMVDFAGWDMPVQYSSIVEEHTAVRSAAGLFDISHMARLIFEGPDALDLIQYVYTNDASSMKIGQARYGLVCNERGGILDDVLVYRLEPFWLMVVNASNREKILAWVKQHQGSRHVQISDKTFVWAMVAVQGPRALELVAPDYPAASGLKYYHAAFQDGASDAPLLVSRTGYTGEDGCEIIMPADHVVTRCDLLEERGGSLGVPLTPCGLGARDTLRLEAAMPLYGHELNEEIDPIQAGLVWAVKLDKGDFIGREALAQRRTDEGLRRRVGLELEGKRIAREGAAVLREGQTIGRVTSGTFAPTLQKAIAMAYVDAAHAAAGTVCTVDVRGKPAPARVVPLPFYRRSSP
jgi:aminomethyltransferase